MRPINDVAKTYRRVTLLGLLGVAGEDDETSLVCLETLNVQSLALLAQVTPPVVDHDTNTTSLLAANTSLLQLSQCETTALSDLSVVTNGLSSDGRSEKSEGANTEASSLLLASLAAAKLTTRLVEPCADAQLPVLAEVVLVKD